MLRPSRTAPCSMVPAPNVPFLSYARVAPEAPKGARQCKAYHVKTLALGTDSNPDQKDHGQVAVLENKILVLSAVRFRYLALMTQTLYTV